MSLAGWVGFAAVLVDNVSRRWVSEGNFLAVVFLHQCLKGLTSEARHCSPSPPGDIPDGLNEVLFENSRVSYLARRGGGLACFDPWNQRIALTMSCWAFVSRGAQVWLTLRGFMSCSTDNSPSLSSAI